MTIHLCHWSRLFIWERHLEFKVGLALAKTCCHDQWAPLVEPLRQTCPNKAASGHGESCKHGQAGRLLATSLVVDLDALKLSFLAD